MFSLGVKRVMLQKRESGYTSIYPDFVSQAVCGLGFGELGINDIFVFRLFRLLSIC